MVTRGNGFLTEHNMRKHLTLQLYKKFVMFQWFFGTWVLSDHFERRTIMLISDLFCLAIVLGVAFSTELWQVYLLLFLKSLFVALFIPAKNGKVKEIVAENQIQAAIGISSMIDNGAKIIGPVLSGLFVATTPAIYAGVSLRL